MVKKTHTLFKMTNKMTNMYECKYVCIHDAHVYMIYTCASLCILCVYMYVPFLYQQNKSFYVTNTLTRLRTYYLPLK